MINNKKFAMKNEKKFIRNNGGFSLIELSIVLIILSLLVVGIIKGSELIKSSKIVGINTELNRYASATEVFLAQYNELPGLLRNPQNKLGEEAKESPNVNTSDFINESGSPLNAESLNFFNHLSLAGLLDDEKYIGSNVDLTSMNQITRKHYPFSKSIKDHFYYVRSDDFEGSFNKINRISMASINNEDGDIESGIMLMLDLKIDDGDPLNGSIAVESREGVFKEE